MPDSTDCPNCRRLAARVGELEARIARLEDELRRARRQAAPFSREEPKKKPKPPGRKSGRGRFSRREPPPEEDISRTVEVPLERCPRCDGPLTDRRSHENIQTDLPLPQPQHTRFLTESAWCPRCRRRVRSRHPGQVSTASGAAGVSLGPNAKALATEMKHRLGVPYAKISDLFAGLRLPVTPGALCQADARLARKAAPVYEKLVRAIRRACAVHADETGWRIGLLSAWLWVFTSRRVTVYAIEQSRAHEVVVEVLGRRFRGVLVSDCFLAYDHRALAEWLKQKCFAHFLKDLARMEREKTRGAVRFPRRLAAVLREALALRDEKRKLSARAFKRRLRRIERRLDALIDDGRNFSDQDNRRFAKRLRKQRAHIFTFLERGGVEATNNRAERALRPAVIVRKTGGCNKTASGARTHSILSSLLVTARQRGVDALDYLGRVLTASGPPPSLLSYPTDSS